MAYVKYLDPKKGRLSVTDTSSPQQIRISDSFARALQGLSFIVFLKWLAIGLEGSFKDAPHYFLYFFCFTFLIALAIRKRLPRISAIMGFLFSLWYAVFVFGSAFGGMSGWKWYEYMVTFIGGPLSLLIIGLSVRILVRK
jgi:hypothetical protein